MEIKVIANILAIFALIGLLIHLAIMMVEHFKPKDMVVFIPVEDTLHKTCDGKVVNSRIILGVCRTWPSARKVISEREIGYGADVTGKVLRYEILMLKLDKEQLS